MTILNSLYLAFVAPNDDDLHSACKHLQFHVPHTRTYRYVMHIKSTI